MPSPFYFEVLPKMPVDADNANSSSDPLVRTFDSNNFVYLLCTAGILLKNAMTFLTQN